MLARKRNAYHENGVSQGLIGRPVKRACWRGIADELGEPLDLEKKWLRI